MDREEALKIVDDGDADGGTGKFAYPFGMRMFKAALGITNPAINRIIIDVRHGEFPTVYVCHALAADRETMADLFQLLQTVPADRVIPLDQVPEQPL